MIGSFVRTMFEHSILRKKYRIFILYFSKSMFFSDYTDGILIGEHRSRVLIETLQLCKSGSNQRLQRESKPKPPFVFFKGLND